MSVILFAMWIGATYLWATVPNVWHLAFAVHIFAWVAQFIGHIYYEGIDTHYHVINKNAHPNVPCRSATGSS